MEVRPELVEVRAYKKSTSCDRMTVNERPLDVQSRNKEGWKMEAVDGSKQHSIDRGSYFLLTEQEILERKCQLEIFMGDYLALRVRFQVAPGQRGGRAQGQI